MPIMKLFKIVACLAFATLLAGQAINPAAAEVLVSAVASASVGVTDGNLSGGHLSKGTMQFDAKDFAPFEVMDLLSSLDDEDDACTPMNGPDTTSTVVAPYGNTLVSSSGSVSSVALTDPRSQAEGTARHNVSVAGLPSVFSENSVAPTAISSATISTTTLANAHTSVPVTISTASFTLTWTSRVHDNTASSAIGGNFTTLASAAPSNASFTVTLTGNPHLGNGGPSSADTITLQPTSTTLAAPSTGTGTATKSGGDTDGGICMLEVEGQETGEVNPLGIPTYPCPYCPGLTSTQADLTSIMGTNNGHQSAQSTGQARSCDASEAALVEQYICNLSEPESSQCLQSRYKRAATFLKARMIAALAEAEYFDQLEQDVRRLFELEVQVGDGLRGGRRRTTGARRTTTRRESIF
ncbi:hypothetical protein VPNG_06079 [Cytospora leucostoma]|uniref:Uncharacterized protein n=1 Tax=Cytospora leucostoma TaxID=1230097 RepID=A0A423WXA2_9PEZI|nr:hypothetical protein VPNG_06079 [Cytospora leucostoma]